MTAFTPARVAGGLALVCALLAAGCGKGEKPTGTVAGTVSYKGAPLTAGNINLISPTGAAGMAKIDPTGHFKVDGELEAGEYKVYATPPQPEPHAPGTKAAGPPKFDLPQKYRDPQSSATTVTVKAGANDVSVEFKD
jgi:hypothetical protein